MHAPQTRRRWWPAGLRLLALLLLASPATAATLAGRLVEAANGHAIEGASVRLLETGQAVRTSRDGGFSFTHLPPGAYTLSTHHVAYADIERALRLAAGGVDGLVIELRPALYRTGEVVVRSSRSTATLGSLPYAAGALADEALRDLPVVSIGDAAARLPGVALQRDGTWGTAVSVRGLGHYSVVALVDNVRIETATEHAGGLSLVNMQDLERVEVMKSAGSVLTGSGALGGAVQLVTRRAAFSDRPRWGGEWTESASGVDGGFARYAAVEHAGASHALRLSGSFREAGDTQTPRGLLANSQFRDWSLNGSLGLRTIGRQALTLLYQRVQAEDTGIPGGAPFPAAAVVRYPLARRELAGLEYVIPNLSPRIALLTARLSRQVIERDVELIQSPVITLTPHATHTTTSGQLEARLTPGAGQLLIIGGELWHRALDSMRERWLYAQNKEIVERPIPLAAYMSGGGFVQDEWSVVPNRARVVLGARWDKSRTHNDPAHNPEYVIAGGTVQTHPAGQILMWPEGTSYDDSWSANAGLNLVIAKPLTCSVLLASAFRSPAVEERFSYLDLGSSLHVGNPSLKPERSTALNVGARLQLERTTLRLDAFGNQLTDLVAETPGTFEGRPAFVKNNIGEARLYGFEATGEQRLCASAAFQGSLAYVRGEDTQRHANLPQIAPLEGRAELDLEAHGAGTLRLACDAAHAQGNPAAGETRTAGWTTWGATFASVPLPAGGAAVRFRLGVENVFDRAYRLHLSTLRGVVKLEPGRNWFAAATATF